MLWKNLTVLMQYKKMKNVNSICFTVHNYYKLTLQA